MDRERPIPKTMKIVWAVAWTFGSVAGAFENGKRFMYKHYDELSIVEEEEPKPKRHIGFTAQF